MTTKQKAPPREDLMKAIVCVSQNYFVKYHRIPADKPERLQHFIAFIKKKFPTATHVNYYGGISNNFHRQDRIN